MEKVLNELVAKLRECEGPNLISVVLYGSAASGEFHPKHSDLNVLCILKTFDRPELEKLSPVVAWWLRKGHPSPQFLKLEELRTSADVFAIEFLDIKAGHRVLFGEDLFAALDVPLALHRLQVEHDLRVNVLRLRRSALEAGQDPKALLRLMTRSISSFAALFRHALIALGEQPPQAKRQVLDRLAEMLGFDPAPFHAVFEVREGQRRERDLDAKTTFAAYLQGVVRVTEEVDRRLAPG
ncbi:MAG TPA: nucleotidyltransferase domain-containing protein [Terriglobia bacterium]|nr:nucleotidyltransferase domain-containing protein [Terriglobia bacterium]